MSKKGKHTTGPTTSSSSAAPPAKRQKITVAPFAAAFPRRTLLSSSRWVNKVPHDIWVYKILHPLLDLKALSTVGRCNTFFEEYWQYVLKQNVIRVPEGCPTMNEAMEVAVIFTERNERRNERNECSEMNPVKVEVGVGEHKMVGVNVPYGTGGVNESGVFMHIPCNNISITGQGKGQTKLLGGFYVKGHKNVKIEQVSVTNLHGDALFCRGSGGTNDVNVDVTDCIFWKNRDNGSGVSHGGSVTATRCVFMENGAIGVECDGVNSKVTLHDCTIHHNGQDGLWAYDHAVVDLHGTKTDIHSNKYSGMWANDHGKVNIHLPSQHNTSHDNDEGDRHQEEGGSIANINADGTFTHICRISVDCRLVIL